VVQYAIRGFITHGKISVFDFGQFSMTLRYYDKNMFIQKTTPSKTHDPDRDGEAVYISPLYP
jgi:hypothetical protein